MRRCEIESKLGKSNGWLRDRTRYGFDIGDLYTVLGLIDTPPREFFDAVLCDEPQDSGLTEHAQELLDQFEQRWREARERREAEGE